MNKWLYHAAGTAGIVGGFLLLGAGNAQASDTTEDLDRGQPAPVAGQPEVLPGLPALPLSGIESLLNSLPLGDAPLRELPLDALGLPNATLGTGGALTDSLTGDGLLQVTGDPLGLPGRSADAALRTLPAPAPLPADASPAADHEYRILPAYDSRAAGHEYRTLPADAPSTAVAGQPEIIGQLPFLTDPITQNLLGGQQLTSALGPLGTVTNLVGQVPLAGPIVNQTTRNLPLVGEIIPSPEGGRTPMGGDLLPPLIAEQVAAEGLYSPELFDTAEPEQLPGLPLVGQVLGPALGPLGQMVGIGNIAGQLPLVGPLLSNVPVVGGLGQQPPAGVPAPGAMPGVGGLDPAAAERPVAGEDPEYSG